MCQLMRRTAAIWQTISPMQTHRPHRLVIATLEVRNREPSAHTRAHNELIQWAFAIYTGIFGGLIRATWFLRWGPWRRTISNTSKGRIALAWGPICVLSTQVVIRKRVSNAHARLDVSATNRRVGLTIVYKIWFDIGRFDCHVRMALM